MADLISLFSGADSVVHLASTVTAGTINPAEAELEAALLHRVLDALSGAAVPHLVVMSSAMVYGAWKDNPVPLTEDAAVRPNPDFDWAVQRRQLERMAREWGQGRGRAVTVLRPTAVVAEDRLGQLANTLRAARAGVVADADPPVQYLHAEDLAAAVVTALDGCYDGALNVAPDGWIPPDTLADLEGASAAAENAVASGAAGERAALAFRPGADTARCGALHRPPVGGGQRPAPGLWVGARPTPTRRRGWCRTARARWSRCRPGAARSSCWLRLRWLSSRWGASPGGVCGGCAAPNAFGPGAHLRCEWCLRLLRSEIPGWACRPTRFPRLRLRTGWWRPIAERWCSSAAQPETMPPAGPGLICWSTRPTRIRSKPVLPRWPQRCAGAGTTSGGSPCCTGWGRSRWASPPWWWRSRRRTAMPLSRRPASGSTPFKSQRADLEA